MKRAERRHHLKRMKAKAVRVYVEQRWQAAGHLRAIKYANHLAVCSCCMCGNPRRHFGEVTWQERKIFISQAIPSSAQ